MVSVPAYYRTYLRNYFFVKLFFALFAVFIYSKITTLGDVNQYISSPIFFSPEIFQNSTLMMEFVGGFWGSIFFRTFLAHIFFTWLSFYGISYAIKRLDLSRKQLAIVLLILSLPSFCIWTSIIGKEAVGCFAIGIITGFLIDFIKNKRSKPKLIEIFAFYLLWLFKPQYLIAILHVFIIAAIFKFKINLYIKLFLIFILLIVDITILYLFKDIIDTYSQLIYLHFSLDAGSTRANIWINNGDFFRKMPYGMFIAMYGPTLQESIQKPFQMITFIESGIIFIFWFYLYGRKFFTDLINDRFNAVFWTISIFLFFWLALVHYPFGALNPGSALRYRENFLLILIILPVFLYKNSYKR